MKIIHSFSHFFSNRLEKRSRKSNHLLALFLSSFIIALFSHLFFLVEWFDGRYMIGMNDGLSQILPFKQLLYDNYTSGNFFYSNQFGMGGGTYSQLGYYFSTSIIFLITVAVTFMLEVTNMIQKPDLYYWADIILVISIIRLSLIISVTTVYFRYLGIRNVPAFIGAIVYGSSIIYFRHVIYWEFFADAMLWLSLLLLGIERIIKEKKTILFIVAVAMCLFDNFYFAYINFGVAGIYIVFRWFISLHSVETSKLKQCNMYVFSGLAGLGISAVSFIPSVYGYLHNHRIPYEDSIPLFGIPDNLFLDSKIVALPAFVMICFCIYSFYKNTTFRLFACMTILSIILHYSPMIASAFNGFSAPQYRWEYFLSLVAGGVVAIGIQHIHHVTKRQVFLSITCMLSIYVISYVVQYGVFDVTRKAFPLFTLKVGYLAIAAIVTVIFLILYIWRKCQKFYVILIVTLVCISLLTSNVYQMVKLPSAGSSQAVTKDFMQSDEYNGKDQQEIIRNIQSREDDSFYRIDWMVGTRNNTPIVQEFNGFSVYSSILNKHLLYYYLYDLEIDMGRESVSRYMTLGDRANVYSILSGKYLIVEKGKKAIPYQFEKLFATGNYVAYENKNILPFFRTTNMAYVESDFAHASVIAKERAMIEGIIINKEELIQEKIPIRESDNLMKDVTVHAINATYHDNQLDVKEENGGIDLQMNNPGSSNSDYYVSFYLKRLDKDEGYTLQVNDYVTSRKKNTSIYKTGVDKLTIRVSAEERVSIRLPKGTYKLADLEIYEENYQLLQAAKKKSEENPNVPISWSGNKVNILYTNEANDRFATLPIPYEKGWRLSINGEKREILQANYAFIGFPLEEGVNNIELMYYPPFFILSLLISIFSFLFVYLLVRKKFIA